MKRSLSVKATLLLAALAAPISYASPTGHDPKHLAVTPDPAVARYAVPASREPKLSNEQLVKLLRKRIKHVFIFYQENRSFDSYFGTFPGAVGLYSQPASQTPGYYEKFEGIDGSIRNIHPFRIGPAQFAADTDDVDHSHGSIVSKIDIVNGSPQMDKFAITEERDSFHSGLPPLKGVQYAELAMAYEDGDTIPFLWRYANRFVLFDHIFQEITGPSTPGNLCIIGAQSGVTQWMLHPEEEAGKVPYGAGVPVLNDKNPYWGSSEDKNTAGKMPYSPFDNPNHPPQINLAYATLPLSLNGAETGAVTQSDRDSAGDLGDVKDDVAYLTSNGKRAVPWNWFEEGFDKEPTDSKSSDPVDASGIHASYITHHNGPQYFGYISNNPAMSSHLKGLQDFYSAIAHHTLPARGVFYVKGGGENLMGLKPACPDPRAQTGYLGDDDHPGYSDAQISEAMVAEAINKIAASPYWKDSAIIITWDDSEGDYDNVPPPLRSLDPQGRVLSDGPRVPFLLISPFAKTHTVEHSVGDQASVVKFVDTLFDLTPLADLPDEKKGREIGNAKGLQNMGPFDDLVSDVTDLLGGFDPARLSGRAQPLPASYVMIPEKLVHTLPQQSGYGLKQIGVLPTDYQKGIKNEIPADFNPRPSTTPSK